jgi:hypothetical protein
MKKFFIQLITLVTMLGITQKSFVASATTISKEAKEAEEIEEEEKESVANIEQSITSNFNNSTKMPDSIPSGGNETIYELGRDNQLIVKEEHIRKEVPTAIKEREDKKKADSTALVFDKAATEKAEADRKAAEAKVKADKASKEAAAKEREAKLADAAYAAANKEAAEALAKAKALEDKKKSDSTALVFDKAATEKAEAEGNRTSTDTPETVETSLIDPLLKRGTKTDISAEERAKVEKFKAETEKFLAPNTKRNTEAGTAKTDKTTTHIPIILEIPGNAAKNRGTRTDELAFEKSVAGIPREKADRVAAKRVEMEAAKAKADRVADEKVKEKADRIVAEKAKDKAEIEALISSERRRGTRVDGVTEEGSSWFTSSTGSKTAGKPKAHSTEGMNILMGK